MIFFRKSVEYAAVIIQSRYYGDDIIHGSENLETAIIGLYTDDKQPLSSLNLLIWASQLTFETSIEELMALHGRLEQCQQACPTRPLKMAAKKNQKEKNQQEEQVPSVRMANVAHN